MKLIEITIGIFVGLVLAVVYLAAWIISWIAAVICGCLLILTFVNWLGYEHAHSAASWHTLLLSWGYVGLCALVVFVIRGLPLFFVKTDPAPPRDEPFNAGPPLRLHL